MRALRRSLPLVSLLIGAAALRVAGIEHHLANDPSDFDEMHNFVVPILRMWKTGTADPSVYSGYPGFFNYLAFLPVVVGHRLAGQFGAFLGARLLVAAFSVLNVALLYRLCRSFAGTAVALFAAALLAFSRGDVRATHYITPDVLVASGALGVLLVLSRPGRWRRWLLAGALVGVTTAVKYTGILAAAPVLTAFAMEPQRRRSLPAAVAAGVLAFAAAAPYAVTTGGGEGMGMGFLHSVQYYYGDGAQGNLALSGRRLALGTVLGHFRLNLGLVALLLAGVGLVWFRPRKPLWPALALVVAAIAAMAMANKVFPRHVLLATTTAAFLAAMGFAALLQRGMRATLGAVLAVAALASPALSSVSLANRYRGPTAADRAVTWVESNASSPALILTTLEPFRVDPARFEVRAVDSLAALAPEALAQYDLVVTSGKPPARLPDAQVLASLGEAAGSDEGGVTILRARAGATLRVAPAPRRVLASHAPEAARRAWDGDAASSWEAPAGPVWMSAEWDAPLTVVRIEVEVGAEGRSWPQELEWQGLSTEGETLPLRTEALRPKRPRRQRVGAPHGQIYVLAPPRALAGIRLVRADGKPWELAEVRVLAAAGDNAAR